ncbi:MAG: metallophosphoesterase, partial [Clostridiales bacterium]|nr:metallophosphoesterase [Clostridiales bacterium]
RKILVRGNHDYWWQAIKNVRRALPPNVYALQNDSLALAGHAVCGCRGWNIPGEAEWLADDEKIYRRELLRLEMALNDGSKHGLPLVAMLHFPPLLRDIRESGFMELLRRFQVKMCVYGHLHGPGIKNAVEGDVGGTEFCLSSMDHLRFMPRLLWQEE